MIMTFGWYGDDDPVTLSKIRHIPVVEGKDAGFTGPLRPDHGRMIWGETGKPGYGLYNRALGAMYLAGLWEGMS